MNKEKIREERIFEIVHCPFDSKVLRAELNCTIYASWMGQLAGAG